MKYIYLLIFLFSTNLYAQSSSYTIIVNIDKFTIQVNNIVYEFTAQDFIDLTSNESSCFKVNNETYVIHKIIKKTNENVYKEIWGVFTTDDEGIADKKCNCVYYNPYERQIRPIRKRTITQ
jgi:hypothetical protein